MYAAELTDSMWFTVSATEYTDDRNRSVFEVVLEETGQILCVGPDEEEAIEEAGQIMRAIGIKPTRH